MEATDRNKCVRRKEEGALDDFFDKQATSIYWKKMVCNRGQFQV